MKSDRKSYLLPTLVFLLIILTGFLFYLDFKHSKKVLTFAMQDIGQGDALFIESPTGAQMLFDAGPPHKILGTLSRLMPPFDHTIDAIVITNPDADHISGFLEVLKNYKVGKVFEPGTFNDSTTYKNLEAEIKKQNIADIITRKGMKLDLGGGVTIDILFPDQDVSSWESNDGSVVARLSYGATSVMLTGDATIKTEQIILKDFPPQGLASTILKVGHHGSHTSSSRNFLDTVKPAYALISDGKDNKYGHPHQDVLDDLVKRGIKIYRTDLLGTIIMQSDGINVSFAFKK
jgi:competence protein ComEC